MQAKDYFRVVAEMVFCSLIQCVERRDAALEAKDYALEEILSRGRKWTIYRQPGRRVRGEKDDVY